MNLPIVIVGAGGFGREVLSILRACQQAGDAWKFEGFIDDRPTPSSLALLDELDSSVVGDIDSIARRRSPFAAILAIGAPQARQNVRDALIGSGVRYPSLVHPASTTGVRVVVDEGVVVGPGARLSTNIRLGAHVHIDQNVTVGHDTTIAEFARLNPQACISGAVQIGLRALIGANATVLQNLQIGDDAVIGAGACVTRDVPPKATAKGVPARF